jgi:hypothetical protein
MASLAEAANTVWALNVAIQIGLLFLLVSRGEIRKYPAFCTYLAVNLLQSGAFFLLYTYGSYSSRAAWQLGWISQGVVVIARGIAAAEVCYQVLARYRGVWALGWRVLTGTGLLVLTIAISFGRHDLRTGIVTLDIGTELGIAAIMAGLFMFVRYYNIVLQEPMRMMGVGFCLYSCFFVLNDLFLQHYLVDYERAWSFVGTLTFLGSLLLWAWALRSPARDEVAKPALLEAEIYQSLMPEMNQRLGELNKQLGHLWKVESHHS